MQQCCWRRARCSQSASVVGNHQIHSKHVHINVPGERPRSCIMYLPSLPTLSLGHQLKSSHLPPVNTHTRVLVFPKSLLPSASHAARSHVSSAAAFRECTCDTRLPVIKCRPSCAHTHEHCRSRSTRDRFLNAPQHTAPQIHFDV